MKRKIYSSLVFTFMFAAVGLVTVHADDSVSIPNTNTVATETSTASEVETSTENSYNNITSTDNTDNTLDINKSVKVNKKIKLQKSLNLDSESVKDMTFTADDSTVVKVSKAGTVTVLRQVQQLLLLLLTQMIQYMPLLILMLRAVTQQVS